MRPESVGVYQRVEVFERKIPTFVPCLTVDLSSLFEVSGKATDSENMCAGGTTNLFGERHCVLANEDDCCIASQIFPDPSGSRAEYNLQRELSDVNP